MRQPLRGSRGPRTAAPGRAAGRRRRFAAAMSAGGVVELDAGAVALEVAVPRIAAGEQRRRRDRRRGATAIPSRPSPCADKLGARRPGAERPAPRPSVRAPAAAAPGRAPGARVRAVRAAPGGRTVQPGSSRRLIALAIPQRRRGSDPLWFKDAVIYETHVKSFYDSNGDGIGDLRGLMREARLPPGPRHHLPVAAAALPVAAQGRRLRHRRLQGHPPRLRHARRLPPAGRGGARARHPRARRAGGEPHLRPAPLVPARAPRAARLARARVLRLERHRPAATRTRASSSPTPRSRTGPGIRRRSSTTGTASSATSRTSTSRTRRCSGRCSTRSRFWAELGVDGVPARRGAVPRRGGRHELREPARHARGASRSPRASSTSTSPGACCSPRRTSGPTTCAPTSARATSATWRSTSRSCRASSWRCGSRTWSRSSRSCGARPPIPDTCQWALFLRNHDELTLEMVIERRARLHVPRLQRRTRG